MIKQQMIIISKDGNDKEYHVTLDISPDNSLNYSTLDQAARALNNLSTNTYVDTQLVRTISVNEELG